MDLAKLTAQLTAEEGIRAFPYVDSRGKLTIGVGHNLADDGISPAIAQALLREDINRAVARLSHIYPDWMSLDEVRQRVLVDLAFNMGTGLVSFHRVFACLTSHDYIGAANELRHSLWYQQVGTRGPKLVQMMFTGVDPDQPVDPLRAAVKTARDASIP